MHRSILQRAGLLIAIGVFSIGSLAQAELRKFSNRDGSKHFEAELIRYLPEQKIVQVRRDSGKLSRFKLSHLSDDDQKYILKRAPLLRVAKDLKLSASPVIGKKEVVKASTSKTTTTPKSYRVTLENTSGLNLEDLKVDYELHWVRDNGTGRRGEENQVARGSALVSHVMARKEMSFNTDAVKIQYKEPFGGSG